MEEEDEEEEINLLDLYDQVVSLRVGATMPSSTNKMKEDRFAARISEARQTLNLEEEFNLDIVGCQICRGRGCAHCRITQDNISTASESDAAVKAAKPTEIVEATQADAEKALLAALRGQQRLPNGQPTPSFVQAMVEAVLTNVDSSLWAGPQAKSMFTRKLDQDVLSSKYYAKEEDSNMQRSHRRRTKHALRGQQLVFVGQIFFLALQPELHPMHDAIMTWCRSRLLCATGVVIGEIHAVAKLSRYQDHLVYLEGKITTASSTLNIEELNAIFHEEAFLKSAESVLHALSEPGDELDEADGLTPRELCSTVTEYVASLRAIGGALKDGSAFFEYGAQTSVMQDWVDGLQYLWILTLQQLLDVFSKEMGDDPSSQRSIEEEDTAAQQEWESIEKSHELPGLLEKVTTGKIIDDANLEGLVKTALSKLKLQLGKVLLKETKEKVKLEIEKICVQRIFASLPSRYSKFSRETFLITQTKQMLSRRELSVDLLNHVRDLCRDLNVAVKEKDKQAEVARLDLRDNVLPWICSRSHANELNLYFEVLNPESTARPGLETWVETQPAGVAVAVLAVVSLVCLPVLGLPLLYFNIRRPYVHADELEAHVEFEEKNCKFRSFTWRVVATRTLRQTVNLLLDSCGFQALAGLFDRTLAACFAAYLLLLPVLASIIIGYNGRDANWVAPVVIGFEMVTTWAIVLVAFIQRRRLTQTNQQMNAYTLDGRRVPDQMRKNWQNTLEVILTAVGVVQFISAAFEPSVPWPEQSSDSIGGFLSVFIVDFGFLNTMEVSFSFLLVMLAVWLFGVHVTASSHSLATREIQITMAAAGEDEECEAEEKAEETNWDKVCRITAQYVMPALGGAFYMVYVKWLCRAFDCDYGESALHLSGTSTFCFQDLHFAWTVLSLFGFTLFVPQATLTTYVAFVPDDELDLLTRPLFLIFTNVLRLPLGVATVLLAEHPQVHTSFSMVASMSLAVYVKFYKPMSVRIVNKALVFSYLAASWINFCALIATFLDAEEDWVLLYFMFGVACWFLGLAAAWTVEKSSTLAIIAGVGFFSATIMAVIVQIQFEGENTTTITILFLVSCLLLLLGIFVGRTLTYKCLLGDEEQEQESRFSEVDTGSSVEMDELEPKPDRDTERPAVFGRSGKQDDGGAEFTRSTRFSSR
eukprot:TRINITY_DN13769_c0_g2_i2.p1 TRINITY_DN13769_c0_g2~~TRINITY_DN13769_c0_g2_i2.p1  ORF type:complete len:1157 (+),score=323.51 TRINITY_DN13769_c0_g2_i2:90-3560(+)